MDLDADLDLDTDLDPSDTPAPAGKPAAPKRKAKAKQKPPKIFTAATPASGAASPPVDLPASLAALLTDPKIAKALRGEATKLLSGPQAGVVPPAPEAGGAPRRRVAYTASGPLWPATSRGKPIARALRPQCTF
jgi:hypothetical protein